jgi:polysaccharide export outer membrane protein
VPQIRSFVRLALASIALGALVSGLPRRLTAQAANSALVLEPGDILEVTIWKEKDLNCTCAVDERGILTLPMLGPTKVVGRAWDTLRDSLLSEYQRQLKNPSVTLTPRRRVLVLGEVTKPGPYFIDPTLSLAGIIAQSGGATPNGDLRRVRVVRNGETVVKSASIEHLLLPGGVHSNDQIFVDRRAWIERNGAFVASAVISTAGILIALIRR